MTEQSGTPASSTKTRPAEGAVPVPVSSAAVAATRPTGSGHGAKTGTAVGPESAALLTADRLLDNRPSRRPHPTGFWRRFTYGISGHLINLGDAKPERLRKELDAKIGRPLTGGARFIPVLTRKGGVGKTTITALLGMALADARSDRVIAIDANPDRGTLAERIAHQSRYTVRDVVRDAKTIDGYNEFSDHVARDATRLDVLASDTDPSRSEAFSAHEYNVVADLASKYYSLILTDCGTGIVHSVMTPTLERADTIVIISGGSVDEAKLASETLTWLDLNGYSELVKNAVVVLNATSHGTKVVRLDEIERHFATRVRAVVRVPFDPQLAAGSAIAFEHLQPETRLAARKLAALVVEGLPAVPTHRANNEAK
ncbi:MinD/ParA family protein [Mycetocola spongiae]|nr:MinD/ParA family protein [Mycetocola spongiae]